MMKQYEDPVNHGHVRSSFVVPQSRIMLSYQLETLSLYGQDYLQN
jgi:hypothetical protein